MTDYKYYESSNERLRIRALWPVLVAVLLVLSSFLLESGVIHGAPIDLQSELALQALAFSNSATTLGIVLISAVLIALIVTRSSMSLVYRIKEALAIIATLIVFGGGGALLNEHWIKPQSSEPRPNIEYLASPASDNALGMSVDEYYSKDHGTQRGRVIYTALTNVKLEINSEVKQHWISETGYTFPSGHSFIAFFIATFFVFFVFTFVDARRNIVFYLLLPWAVMVCLSRVMLFVHRPLDVIAGAMIGASLGILAWYLIRFVVRILVQAEIKIK